MSSCPECGVAGVPLIFGLPVPEAVAAARSGELALGGCLMPPQPPNWECPGGHRWRDGDETAFDERLLTVLAAHGYRTD
ncbi:hypothetical protein KZ829_21360 [Actinoplanes hulinensis]|uniref:Uncharacterized protein n=1 Tax=Actinoplanes hulinensis TaxID=1144547 RepID=A0ABS7B5G9_9ACTN|nr:hypothetical protein [Actinoplanes hulinensis]MBW6436292.1 hypothetical protein [Actinoplanes hulinensis]